ncbi:hypothetical protein GGI12_004122 [Dipsacomyces acuminosporus]|nr:hypothetical protein GGI12_004122 [Dipsacomyces acuminosporus]
MSLLFSIFSPFSFWGSSQQTASYSTATTCAALEEYHRLKMESLLQPLRRSREEEEEEEEQKPKYDAQASAQQARKLLSSLRTRHAKLAKFLQEHREFKTNPLCEPMCKELERKINLMASHIRIQQNELKQLVYNHELFLLGKEDEIFQTSRSSSFSSFSSFSSSSPKDAPAAPASAATNDAQPGEWLAINRAATLKEVIDFSIYELKGIEGSRLLSMSQPKRAAF